MGSPITQGTRGLPSGRVTRSMDVPIVLWQDPRVARWHVTRSMYVLIVMCQDPRLTHGHVTRSMDVPIVLWQDPRLARWPCSQIHGCPHSLVTGSTYGPMVMWPTSLSRNNVATDTGSYHVFVSAYKQDLKTFSARANSFRLELFPVDFVTVSKAGTLQRNKSHPHLL